MSLVPIGSQSQDVLVRWDQYALANGLHRTMDEYWEARRLFIGRVVNADFNEFFGSDKVDLNAWRGLCRTEGIDGADELPTVKACRKALEHVHCNIIDLVDAARQQQICRTFRHPDDLVRYSKDAGKFYPLKSAKENELLEMFLVVMQEGNTANLQPRRPRRQRR